MKNTFIILHERLSGEEIYVNPEHIMFFKTNRMGKTWTSIYCNGTGGKIEVRETDKEIDIEIKKINNPIKNRR